MFQKQALRQAKKDTLKLGIGIINAQAKAMREALEIIKTIYIKEKTSHNTLLITHALENQWKSINFSIEHLKQCKDKILLIHNLNLTKPLSMLVDEPFRELLFYNRNKSFPDKFFTSNTFKQMEEAERAFKNADLNQKNILSFRANVAGVLFTTLCFLSLASLIAVGITLAVCITLWWVS